MTNTPTSRPTARSLVRAALPIAGFYLTGILLGLTDLAVVGVLGTEALAAVGLGKTIVFSLLVVGFAVLSIGTVLMAEAADAAQRGPVLLAALLLTIPFTAIALSLPSIAERVLRHSDYPPEVISLFAAYTQVLAWAIGPALVFAAFKNVLVAVGRTGPIFALSLLILVANAVASIVLVHGIGGWGGLGVAGAAWATVGVEVGAAVVLVGVVSRGGRVRQARLRRSEVLARVRTILGLGWAAGAQQILESMLFVAVLYLLGLHSAAWLAAGTVAFAALELTFAVGAALGEVASAHMAALRATGARKAQRRLVFLTAALAVGCAGTLALLVFFLPSSVIAVFAGKSVSPEVRTLMEIVIVTTAPLFIFDALQIVFVHLLRGLRRTVLPMLFSTSCYWMVGLAGGLILTETLELGGAGIWIGFGLGLASAAVLLGVMTARSVFLE
ncbi:MAG: MATE family efflux transporter [Pseudomonadota bacterium]